MNIINSSNTSFRSTIVPVNTKIPIANYLNALKTCNLKSLPNMSVEKCYEKLFIEAEKTQKSSSGIMLCKDENNNVCLRFLGYDKGNDEYIFKQLKKVDRNVKYVRDYINDGYDNRALEIIC